MPRGGQCRGYGGCESPTTLACGRGDIGRHASLDTRRGRPGGFKSRRPYVFIDSQDV